MIAAVAIDTNLEFIIILPDTNAFYVLYTLTRAALCFNLVRGQFCGKGVFFTRIITYCYLNMVFVAICYLNVAFCY
jgi:hypothetical protein